MYVVVIRNVMFGCVVCGTFPTEAKAKKWGRSLKHSEWAVAPVVKPGKEWDAE